MFNYEEGYRRAWTLLERVNAEEEVDDTLANDIEAEVINGHTQISADAAALEASLSEEPVVKKTYTVRKLVDAYMPHDVDVDAVSPEAALTFARGTPDEELNWVQGEVQTFDHEDYVVLLDGKEVLGL